MNLRVGLIGHSSLWEQVLLHEGVPFETVAVPHRDDISRFSMIAVGRKLDHAERIAVEEYLKVGGSVLGCARHLEGVAGTTSREEDIEYLVGEGEALFPDVYLLDVGSHGAVAREANHLRTQSGVSGVFAGTLGGGYAVLLPFDPVELLSDYRAVSKNFYAGPERLPSERVSLVGKGELRHLLHRCFELLHHMRGLPYAHLWYYPNDERTLFAFRVDTDGGSLEEVDTLYHLARDNDIAISWFLDVKSHLSWLHRFSGMAGQEIGVHCYEHQTYTDFKNNLSNILHAKKELETAGIHARGFAAPFGIWNPELARATEEAGLAYASEFSFMYDALPFFPDADGHKFPTLQIPIHPICIGNLKRAGYTDQRMMEHFAMITNRKLMRNEPLFYYHHPSHRSWKVVEYIAGLMEHHRIPNTTLGAYGDWWRRRLEVRPAISFASNELTIRALQSFPDVWIHLSTFDSLETWIPTDRVVGFSALHWQHRSFAPPPPDLRRIREYDPRRVIGDIYSTLVRRFR